ncbi:MAG: glycogen/starch synthase [Thermodesulfobacteriota bacterium]|nr:glycogen/starch synthase [Thermodesulfobacteriota bacterium]
MKESKKFPIEHIWMVSREYDGLAGAGGVKDVCRQLAEALVEHGGCQVRVVLPRYGFMDAEKLGFSRLQLSHRSGVLEPRTAFDVDMNYPGEERRETVSVWTKRIRDVELYLLEAERFAEKLGVYTYTVQEEKRKRWQQRGSGHFDFFSMNILLQKATLDLMILLDHRPDIIHCQDGHAATLPAMMRENPGYRQFFCNTGAVVTIHNAGLGYHQEVADLDFARVVTGLPEFVIRSSRLGNSFDPFIAAAGYAQLNTVSENYGRELQETSEDSRTGWLGHELLQRGVKLAGITNGINPEDFNPARAKELGLAAPFNPEKGDLSGKKICKEQMLSSCSSITKWSRVEQYGRLSKNPELPLFTFIGRLTSQKGVDVLLQAVSLLLAGNELEEEKQTKKHEFQLLILGSGDPELERQLQELTKLDIIGDRICFLKGYDPELANKIYAAGDFFVIPSLYEPCGLTDYIAQLLGNLPVVHHVGGLVKVLDGKTGIAYRDHDQDALADAMQRALELYSRDPEQLKNMQQAAVQRIRSNHSWQNVMQDYLSIYQEALEMSY